MKKNQFAQKGEALYGEALYAGAARAERLLAVPIRRSANLSRLCPQNFFIRRLALTQTNQYKSKLIILITCSFTTKARKTPKALRPLEPEQLKPLTPSQTKESFLKSASPKAASLKGEAPSPLALRRSPAKATFMAKPKGEAPYGEAPLCVYAEVKPKGEAPYASVQPKALRPLVLDSLRLPQKKLTARLKALALRRSPPPPPGEGAVADSEVI